jgi:hypothetical protein
MGPISERPRSEEPMVPRPAHWDAHLPRSGEVPSECSDLAPVAVGEHALDTPEDCVHLHPVPAQASRH